MGCRFLSGLKSGYFLTVSNRRVAFFIAGNYLGDIMDCALSEYAPLAISATEVLRFIIQGSLAAPNDVIYFFSV